MKRQTWKAIERRVATALGGERVPVNGRHSGGVPDIDHPDLAIEVKATADALPTRLQKGQEQASRAGRATGRVPVVVDVTAVSRGGSPAEINVVFKLEDFLEYTKRVRDKATQTKDDDQD